MRLPVTILLPAATSSVRLSSSLSLPPPCLSHQACELILVPGTSQAFLLASSRVKWAVWGWRMVSFVNSTWSQLDPPTWLSGEMWRDRTPMTSWSILRSTGRAKTWRHSPCSSLVGPESRTGPQVLEVWPLPYPDLQPLPGPR